jgi:hypothetical protein
LSTVSGHCILAILLKSTLFELVPALALFRELRLARYFAAFIVAKFVRVIAFTFEVFLIVVFTCWIILIFRLFTFLVFVLN